MAIPGDWFHRYKICQSLGQGGMGTLFLADDQWTGERCVIKQLTDRFSDEIDRQEAIRLFKRETSILASLNHPGIVRVRDNHVSEDGRYFLVMDLIYGDNLETTILKAGRFSSEEAVQVGIQCCEILEYLHGRNPPIIYRDLKPSNLMLTPDGRVVFIDFGIARFFMPRESATRVVTAGYSPPEQYFGKPETRSDLYSLGATLSHLLTGSRPTPLKACMPIMINPKVLPSLDDVVGRLTAHFVQDRPPSALSVRYDLYRIYQEIHPEFAIPTTPGFPAGEHVGGRTGDPSPKLSAHRLRLSLSGHGAPVSYWNRLQRWFHMKWSR